MQDRFHSGFGVMIQVIDKTDCTSSGKFEQLIEGQTFFPVALPSQVEKYADNNLLTFFIILFAAHKQQRPH